MCVCVCVWEECGKNCESLPVDNQGDERPNNQNESDELIPYSDVKGLGNERKSKRSIALVKEKKIEGKNRIGQMKDRDPSSELISGPPPSART